MNTRAAEMCAPIVGNDHDGGVGPRRPVGQLASAPQLIADRLQFIENHTEAPQKPGVEDALVALCRLRMEGNFFTMDGERADESE